MVEAATRAEAVQGAFEVGIEGAADAAAVEFDEFLGAGEFAGIDADRAQLVQDHGDPPAARIAQQGVQPGGLPAAQKAGEDRDGNTSQATVLA